MGEGVGDGVGVGVVVEVVGTAMWICHWRLASIHIWSKMAMAIPRAFT